MLTPEQALDHATDIVARATRAGADAADSVVVSSGSTEVSVRLGKVEDIQRSESGDLGLRVFVGSRSASASTSDLSPAAIAALVERTVAMARLAPEDPFAALAPAERLATGPFDDFDGNDGIEIEPDALKLRALEAEDAARAVEGVTNSEGGGASHGTGITAIATSTGFGGARGGSSHSVSASVLVGEGARMQRDYYSHSTRHLDDLDAASAIGAEAGRRAVARLDPVRLKSGAMTVVFAPRVANSLLGHFAGAITGAAIARKTSFLIDRLGEAVFAPGISIVDDPWRARGMRSRAFDGEGLATKPAALIDNGVLTGWIADVAAARQLGIAPTGHAWRGVSGAPGAGTSNLHMAAGNVSPTALIADIADGFYVTELIGMGVNGLTGDYSRGASGFRIVDGEIAGPVAEVTIAGNLKDMFATLIPADDLVFRYTTNAPTIRIDGMTLAGE
ncbi:TldD/PmbA family protein [Sphingomonas sp. SUN039]|uniref:TldD/PmbA family protein n=1 Tax=Sphingomonas sp. SUN039 TaxID=2937787 RepID=UPI0021641018|nr:TldD/PmbA family protein [Sphingomonas sp. SUN039]UVO54956.1 TldD/PmbA family protein [Sphingomonas sp. SUN039]